VPDYMPYTTEKSMVFQVVESWLNGSREVALQAMWDLLDGRSIADLPPLDSTTLNYPPYATPALRRKHVEEDWWGREQNPTGQWEGQDPYDPVNNPTTGFWKHWYGDAEPVFRETMIRALAISLGVPRESGQDTDKYHGKRRPVKLRGGTQHWPISILWKCPSPWYEGWIEFKAYGGRARAQANDGHVTVVLTTPSHGVKLYTSPIRPVGSPTVVNDPYNAYALNPTEPAGPEGLWVVSQAAHVQIPTPPPTATPPGSWTPPTLGQPVLSVGSVVCVSPAVGDGGAAPSGIPFTP
jgi:hypothetical protein